MNALDPTQPIYPQAVDALLSETLARLEMTAALPSATIPAITAAPRAFEITIDSPVMRDSSASVIPSNTFPSAAHETQDEQGQRHPLAATQDVLCRYLTALRARRCQAVGRQGRRGRRGV